MHTQRGFTLLASIFILIILALAGTYCLKMGARVQQGVNYDLLTARARHAGNSALALAQFQWLRSPKVCPQWDYHFDDSAGSLAGFDVAITCSHIYAYQTGESRYYSVLLQALASTGKFGDRDYVSQVLTKAVIVEKNIKVPEVLSAPAALNSAARRASPRRVVGKK